MGSGSSTEVVVSSSKGKIKGKVVKVKNAKSVQVYRKIPFAKPPLGKLRFMPPQPAERWDGIRDGTNVGSMPMYASGFVETMEKAFPFRCPDDPIVMNEDCLHLTVYSPCSNKGKKLPVMVYFNGGGYTMGSEREYDGAVLAGFHDVVVVIPNYRVGIFGFLSLGKNSECTGNAGILDQQMALKWVQENIKAFGGDKDNVTIFGESAGGNSVHLHIVSPLSRGLFHKAISQSGQISMQMLFNGVKEINNVNKMALEYYKIHETEDLKILEALQKLPAEKLASIGPVFEEAKVQFNPVVDGKVLEKAPEQYLADNEFSKVPYIVGCNSSEGACFAVFLGPDFEKGVDEEMVKMLLPFDLSDEGWKKCKEFYKTDEMGDDRYSKVATYIFGDACFVAPASHGADVHAASGATVYKYVGNFQLKMHHDPEYGKDVPKKPSWCICDHGDDIFLTFGQPFSSYPAVEGVKYSKEEEELSRKWMTYITNFAKTGDPNLGGKVDSSWPKYKPGGDELILNHEISTLKGYRSKEVKFWIEVMPQYISQF